VCRERIPPLYHPPEAIIRILLAVGMFILKVKVHSFGTLSIGGIIALVIGSMMLIKTLKVTKSDEKIMI
jgi:membrane-bound ClpP family serine protease